MTEDVSTTDLMPVEIVKDPDSGDWSFSADCKLDKGSSVCIPTRERMTRKQLFGKPAWTSRVYENELPHPENFTSLQGNGFLEAMARNNGLDSPPTQNHEGSHPICVRSVSPGLSAGCLE